MEEYALFRPNNQDSSQGEWMIPKRTIESYGLVTDDRIWFRARMQIVNVMLPDGSQKKMMLDVCQPIKGLIAAIADKMSLHHAEAFGIQVYGTKRFLKMKNSLYEVAPCDAVFTLKKRHFIQEGELNRDDPMLLHLTYVQAHDNIVDGLYPCTRDEIIRFGALNMMIDSGKCSDDKKVNSVHQVSHDIIPKCYQSKDIEKEIFNGWKKMNAMTPIDAKYKYLQLCMTLRSYGMNIYAGGIEPKGVVQPEEGKKKKLSSVFMAFSPTDLKMLSPEHKVLMCEPYEHLKTWKFSDETITFDFAKYNNGETIVFYTKEGEDIFSLVAGYMEIITMKASKAIVDDRDLEKATEVELTKKKKTAAVKTTTVKTRIAAVPPPIAQAAQITDSSNVFVANKEYALPVNFSVDLKEKAQSNEEIWRNQLRNQSDNLLSLLKPLSESFRGGSKMANEKIKQFGFYVDGIRAAVMSGAASVEDREVLEAMTNNLMDAVRDYMDICAALEKDPNNPALLAALADAEKRVQMCTQALNACSQGLVMNVDQDVVFELSTSICADVDCACELARTLAGDIVEQAITDAQTNARLLMYGSQSMGLAMSSDECQSIMKDLLANCKNSTVNLLETSQLKGTAAGGPLEIDVDDICKGCDLVDNFVEDIKNNKNNKRKNFIESTGNCLQMADWLSTLQNMRIEDVQKAAIEMKKEIPIFVKYMKENVSQVEIDDAKRQFVISNLKEMTVNAKVIMTNADQTQYKSQNNDDIREAAGLIADSIRAVMGDEVNEVVHNSMYSDSKKAAISCAKLNQILKKQSRNEKNAKYSDQLMKAARMTSLAAEQLLAPVEEDEDERKFIEKSKKITSGYVDMSTELASLTEVIEEGRSDIVEEKIQLDLMMQKLEQDVNTFQHQDMTSSIHTASSDYRMAATELKREYLLLESATEFEEVGIKEELNEDALKSLEEFSKLRHQLDVIEMYNYHTPEVVACVSQKSKEVLEKLIKASKTSKKKNERKMVLDAAMKLSNETSRLLTAVEQESVGVQVNKASIENDLTCAEKQVVNILKIEEAVDFNITQAVEVTEEVISAESVALDKMKLSTSEIEAIYQDIQKEVQHKKEVADASEDPKLIVEAALQEAVVVMIGSSIGVLSTATQAQTELVAQLSNPQTSQGVLRNKEYADELVKAVDEVKDTALELQRQVKDDKIDSDELVKTADKIGKKVERVVVSCRAGTKTKTKSNRYKELLDASKKLADATKNLLTCAKDVDEFDDTPIVVQMNMPPPPPPVVVTDVKVDDVQDDVETFGIDEYTLREIEQQKKIFDLEKKLQAAKKKKIDLEELAKTFQ
ncbi:talin, putative [Entamoeba invadens IP1]|uniref:Talin, putative n=1 Tax=Entamoeba invadens IP1 TaxID=370355 RepID=A0A0A1UFA4_ENTIV|nr:talin, putative [Entamoeba invadens IP1]ELP95163.1 talin, putative [Entamoeba invadens IP1]|eukprot:XP_004261934.1 talin, putative [Entamoeba invadens IP1]